MIYRSCYINCLDLCLLSGIKSIAFPCISTGMFRYPSLEAADIALNAVREWLLLDNHHSNMERIVFVTRKLRDEEIYSTLMRYIFPCN